jgi:hypothetical protein
MPHLEITPISGYKHFHNMSMEYNKVSLEQMKFYTNKFCRATPYISGHYSTTYVL